MNESGYTLAPYLLEAYRGFHNASNAQYGD